MNYKLDIEDMEDIARDFLVEEFNIDLEIPIVKNNRLKSTLGRFRSSINRASRIVTPVDIEIAGVLFENDNSEDLIIGVLKHECTHYALQVLGLPNNDSDREFINACVERDIPLTGTINVIRERTHHLYNCDTCNEVHKIRTKAKWGYSCGTCKENLRYVSKVTEIK